MYAVPSPQFYAGLTLSLLLAACSSVPTAPIAKPAKEVLIIAHRGASGLMPEHTIEAYDLALHSYADFIEPDLIMTKDNVLIVRHENELSDSTDVAKKFPKRKKTKTIDGEKITGWFSEDFTLKEIKTLRANQRFDIRDQSYNGKFAIPTFEEVLKLIKEKKTPTGKPVGIYPEIKHGRYFRGINKPMENQVLELLKKYGYSKKTDPAIIQAFEKDTLIYLRPQTELRLMQLLGSEAVSDQTLKDIATYADGIGPSKSMILPSTPEGNLAPATDLIQRAHADHLFVHPYTFRSDRNFLHPSYKEDPVKEYQQFFELGVDGVFTDFPEDAAKARESTGT